MIVTSAPSATGSRRHGAPALSSQRTGPSATSSSSVGSHRAERSTSRSRARVDAVAQAAGQPREHVTDQQPAAHEPEPERRRQTGDAEPPEQPERLHGRGLRRHAAHHQEGRQHRDRHGARHHHRQQRAPAQRVAARQRRAIDATTAAKSTIATDFAHGLHHGLHRRPARCRAPGTRSAGSPRGTSPRACARGSARRRGPSRRNSSKQRVQGTEEHAVEAACHVPPGYAVIRKIRLGNTSHAATRPTL